MTKVVLITGASRGIGRATARLLGARGWSVGVNYAHNEAAARETAAEVGRAGGHARVIPGDVPNPARFPTGCRFHPRCPVMVSKCLEAPPLEGFGGSRLSRCWRSGEIDAGSLDPVPEETAR